jgi:hypothetical protein
LPPPFCRLSAARIHQGAHLANGCLKPGEHGFSHKKVPDVQFHKLRDGGNRTDSCEIKAMSGVHFKTQGRPLLRGRDQAKQFMLAPVPLRLAIGTRVKFADVGANGTRCRKLGLFRVDKQGDADARRPQTGDLGSKPGLQGGHIQPTLGGQFRTLFGHKAAGIRPDAQGKVDHLLSRRHLEIEGKRDPSREPCDVIVANVPAVLAQMGRDAISTGRRSQKGRPQRVGMPAPARITDGRHVINVDAKAQAAG